MGVDGAKAESVVNLTGNRAAVLWTANAFLLAAISSFFAILRATVRLAPLSLRTPITFWYEGSQAHVSKSVVADLTHVSSFHK